MHACAFRLIHATVMPRGARGGFYAVKVGRSPGVYTSWDDASKQVTGFPQAKHKKFKTREDAQAYINGSSVSTPPSRVAPSSRQSSATSSLKSVTPKTRHSRKGKPYERPSNAARSTQKDAQVRGKQPYQYKRLDMQWTPQVERDLIKDGWLIAFTDGGCSSNGKFKAAAGSGVYWANPRNAPMISERVPGKQSNQCAELYAILRALETDPDPSKPLHIFTDSSYSIQCLTDWINIWMARGWTTKEGGPVINVDLIKLIHFMISKREGPVELSWVKGHSNVPGNKKADKLAVQAIGRPMPHFRDFNADREERFLAYRLSKRKPEETKEVIDIDDVEEEAEEEEIDDSWLLDTDEEQAEIEEADTE